MTPLDRRIVCTAFLFAAPFGCGNVPGVFPPEPPLTPGLYTGELVCDRRITASGRSPETATLSWNVPLQISDSGMPRRFQSELEVGQTFVFGLEDELWEETVEGIDVFANGVLVSYASAVTLETMGITVTLSGFATHTYRRLSPNTIEASQLFYGKGDLLGVEIRFTDDCQGVFTR